MSFEKWWLKNEELYTLVGVKKAPAKCIWDEAINSLQEPICEQIQKLIETLKDEN